MQMKRALRVGLDLQQIARLIGITDTQMHDYVLHDERVKELVESEPMRGALELAEAMHVNAIEHNNATIQKFLAKNRIGFRDEVKVDHGEMKIKVEWEELPKNIVDGEIEDAEVKSIEERTEHNFVNSALEALERIKK